MKERFELTSRYGDKHILERIGDETSTKYQLHTKFSYRCGITEDTPDMYTFIDPSGGPFITLGYDIEGHKVKAIHSGAIIEFEQ